jgi:hypothetical protein
MNPDARICLVALSCRIQQNPESESESESGVRKDLAFTVIGI